MATAEANTTAATPSASAASLKDRGNAAFQKGEFKTAIVCYTAALAQDPRSAPLLSNRAAAYIGLGDEQSLLAAVADADACIAVDATWIKAYIRKLDALLLLKRREEGLAVLELPVVVEASKAGDAKAKLQTLKQAFTTLEPTAAGAAAAVATPKATSAEAADTKAAEPDDLDRVLHRVGNMLDAAEAETMARALSDLAEMMFNREMYKREALARGAVPSVAKAMTSHSSHAGVQTAGAKVLRTLAFRNQSVIDSAAELDLLTPLTAGLDRFQHDHAVVSACLGALTVFCSRHEVNSKALRPHHHVLKAITTTHAGQRQTVQTAMFLLVDE